MDCDSSRVASLASTNRFEINSHLFSENCLENKIIENLLQLHLYIRITSSYFKWIAKNF